MRVLVLQSLEDVWLNIGKASGHEPRVTSGADGVRHSRLLLLESLEHCREDRAAIPAEALLEALCQGFDNVGCNGHHHDVCILHTLHAAANHIVK